jgi:hypothetical protein
MATIGFKFGPQVVQSYRRLSYTPWHALAEFVDNSTQAYLNHQEALDPLLAARGESCMSELPMSGRTEGSYGLLTIRPGCLSPSWKKQWRSPVHPPTPQVARDTVLA